jgi:hypothetical protein
MWSLLSDLLGSVFLQWRLWKWIHDPPLKGDRPKRENDKQPPLVKAVTGVLLFIWIVFVGAFLIMLGQGIYKVVTEGIG